MKLTSAELALLQLVFIHKSPKQHPESFVTEKSGLPDPDGEWAPIYDSLIQKGLMDQKEELTKFGIAIAISKCTGVNFEKDATRPNASLNYAASMALGGMVGIINKLEGATQVEIKKMIQKMNKLAELYGEVTEALSSKKV